MRDTKISATLDIDTSQAEENLDRLIAKLAKIRKPWWCPMWLYKALGN